MIQWFNKKMNKKRKGFTLIELVVVIAILGILAALAIPRFTGVRDKAAISTAEANARTILSAVGMYYAEEGATPTDANLLDDYLDVSSLGGEITTNGSDSGINDDGSFYYTKDNVTVKVNSDGSFYSSTN